MKALPAELQAQLIDFIASALRYVHSDGHYSETLHKQGTRLANTLSCELTDAPDVTGEAYGWVMVKAKTFFNPAELAATEFNRRLIAEGEIVKVFRHPPTQSAVPAGINWPSEAAMDEHIKTLMVQVGFPNSTSIYQAFKQFQNTIQQTTFTAAPQPQQGEEK